MYLHCSTAVCNAVWLEDEERGGDRASQETGHPKEAGSRLLQSQTPPQQAASLQRAAGSPLHGDLQEASVPSIAGLALPYFFLPRCLGVSASTFGIGFGGSFGETEAALQQRGVSKPQRCGINT